MEEKKHPKIRMEKQVSFGSNQNQNQNEKQNEKVFQKHKSFRLPNTRQLSFKANTTSTRTSKRGDTLLHALSRSGNLLRLQQLFALHTTGPDLASLLSKRNDQGETPLYAAAEGGHSSLVSELLLHMDLHSASLPARNGYDPFHIAARLGHVDVLNCLLNSFPSFTMTTDQSNMTALHTAAAQGHSSAVDLLLRFDSNMALISRNNGKTPLHSAARMGHSLVLRSLVAANPLSAFRPDNKGQTALHMAAKAPHAAPLLCELLQPDPSLANIADNKGNTALHVAVAKARIDNVKYLLQSENVDVNVNAVNKSGLTPLDLAERHPPEISLPLVALLKDHAAKPGGGEGGGGGKQLKQTVSDIKHDVESQLKQSRQTGFRVHKIAKRLKKLHISGLNNAINSATIVAVLIATVAFAAIFTVPGQFVEAPTPGYTVGQAHIARNAAFIVFFVFDSMALFISLAVVVVQTSVVVIEHKEKKQLVFVINKLMWMACIFISIAFISLTYIVVGIHSNWLAIYATIVGGTIMLTTIGAMCYCIVSHRIEESKFRLDSRSRSLSTSLHSESEMLNTRMYAL